MATSSVGSSTSSNSLLGSTGKSANSQATTAEDMQTRFLNLLITQLKNQDPMNPTDANQMTAQLSQISTVSGIEKLNATMSELLSSYSASQNMQAAAMIGKTVFIAGKGLELGAQGAIGGIDMSSAADSVTVSIKNAAGKVVATEELGSLKSGIQSFYWDGTQADGTKAEAGNYTFSVQAKSGSSNVDNQTLQAGTINALTMLSNGVSLQLNNNKSISYSDIRQILN